jgi:DNA-binding beta-propeller fold protein YncE
MGRTSAFAALILGLAAAMSLAGQAATAPAYEVVHGWPTLPEGRILGAAAGVAVDSKGDVLVFHRGRRTWSEPLPLTPINEPVIAVFDGRTGRLVREWGSGVFAMPHGLSVDPDDNVWITDVALHQVMKFSPDGRLLLTVGQRGKSGNGPDRFNRPTDVAILPDGSFYVSDGYRNTRVAHFAPDGRFLRQWGRPGRGPGEFDTPHGIKVGADGRVYVADRENDRVQVFESDGRFVTQWSGPGVGRPYALELTDFGAVIADGGVQPRKGPDRSAANLVDRNGNPIAVLGRFGNQDGQFRMAHDVAADRDGNLYVVDIAGQRVQKFRPTR